MSALLTPSQLHSMRMTFNRTLVDAATIWRKTASNAGGEEVVTWNPLQEVPCRISYIGGGETGVAGGRIVDETTHVVTVTAETDVEEADQLVIDGTTYTVTLVRKRGSWELSRRVEAKESA